MGSQDMYCTMKKCIRWRVYAGGYTVPFLCPRMKKVPCTNCNVLCTQGSHACTLLPHCITCRARVSCPRSILSLQLREAADRATGEGGVRHRGTLGMSTVEGTAYCQRLLAVAEDQSGTAAELVQPVLAHPLSQYSPLPPSPPLPLHWKMPALPRPRQRAVREMLGLRPALPLHQGPGGPALPPAGMTRLPQHRGVCKC